MSPVNLTSQTAHIQTQTNEAYFDHARRNLGNDRLDRQGFMRLILAQVQHQDPTDPSADPGQMMSQQLMMEQVEQMDQLLRANKFSQAGALIGQMVDLPAASWNFEQGISNPPSWDYLTNTPKRVQGIVESVQLDRTRNKALLKVDGVFYDAELVQQISQGISGSEGGATP